MPAAVSTLSYRTHGGFDDYHYPHPACQRDRLLPGPSGCLLAERAGAAARRWKTGEEDLVLTDFYLSFSAVCFTLLGLWLIVVQTRHGEWRDSPLHRRRAYGVAMHFSLPGLMSLLALVDPASSALWRVSFAIAATGGAVALIALRGPAPGRPGLAAYVLAIALYALVGILAVAPGIVTGLVPGAAPVRAEAILLTTLVFAGVNVAWLLLFEQAPPGPAHAISTTPGHQASPPPYYGDAIPGEPDRDRQSQHTIACPGLAHLELRHRTTVAGWLDARELC